MIVTTDEAGNILAITYRDYDQYLGVPLADSLEFQIVISDPAQFTWSEINHLFTRKA
jgi:hypothetical protein